MINKLFDFVYHKVLRQPHTLESAYIKRLRGEPLVVFLHGIGNSGNVWHNLIESLPSNVQYISPDLLGFGYSNKPDYIEYDIKTHAAAVVRTIKRGNFDASKIIIVGHSLGSLVAVEIARLYPQKVNSLILASPPFYKPNNDSRLPSGDDILKSIYKLAQDNPDNFLEAATLAKRSHLVTKDFEVNKNNINAYMSTLNSSIVSQSSLNDAIRLPDSIHIDIIRGAMDPLVLVKNIKALQKKRPSVQVTTIIAGHEINQRYEKAMSLDITEQLSS